MNAALLIAVVFAAPAAPSAADDRVLQALADELARAQTLKMDQIDSPYYLSAAYSEQDSFAVAASFGALTERGGGKTAQVKVSVRVGDANLDNTNFVDRDSWSWMMGNGDGHGPADPDYDALRHALWLRFDTAYKAAAEAIAKKRAFLETRTVEDRPADFGPAKVATLVLPIAPLEVDQARWTALVKKASAVFRGYPALQQGDARFRATVATQRMVTSDPAQHRFSLPSYSIRLRATAQAADGMEVEAKYEQHVASNAELPAEKELIAAAHAVAKRAQALANAPLASEDYVGPVMFSGKAAAAFFLHTLGVPLSAPRENLGAPRGGRLTERLGKHVTVKQLSVRDDPTLKQWKGRSLLGHFPIDDDSVVPQPIRLVEKGVLRTYFMSRIPTRKVTGSNGHSRGGQGSVGNLIVEATARASRAALKKKLIEYAEQEDLEYGLLVEELDDGGRGGYGGYGSPGTVMLPAPSVVWRVYADGREELERGTRFKPATLRVLKEIVGVGNDAAPVNLLQRDRYVSVIAPTVLVRVMELQKLRADFEKPPALARPQF